jgi:hypothetical protein
MLPSGIKFVVLPIGIKLLELRVEYIGCAKEADDIGVVGKAYDVTLALCESPSGG